MHIYIVCVCSMWVPCVALPSGGGSSVGPSPLCGSPLWVPCAGPLCGSPVWVPCVGPLCVGPLRGSLVALRPCGINSRDVSRSFTRSRLYISFQVPFPFCGSLFFFRQYFGGNRAFGSYAQSPAGATASRFVTRCGHK